MSKKTQIGKLPQRYSFMLNPYLDFRASKCPICNQPTLSRKFVLLIHIENSLPMALGKTCRYCPRDELIIAHQDELEEQMVEIFSSTKPDVIGNEYLVIGTVDRKVWQEGRKGKGIKMNDLLNNLSVFKEKLDLKIDPGGWRPPEAKQ
jgi:hypothetical protein